MPKTSAIAFHQGIAILQDGGIRVALVMIDANGATIQATVTADQARIFAARILSTADDADRCTTDPDLAAKIRQAGIDQQTGAHPLPPASVMVGGKTIHPADDSELGEVSRRFPKKGRETLN